MTDSKTATERLREMLDARGVEYETDDKAGFMETSWRGCTAFQLSPSAKMTMIVTPEQAVAATLGEQRDPTKDWLLSVCNQATQDYVAELERKLEAATLGSGECEMVTSGTPCDGNADKACTRCGAYGIGEFYDGDGHISTPRFCPNCGRKVM